MGLSMDIDLNYSWSHTSDQTSASREPAFCESADPAICGDQLSLVNKTTPTAAVLSLGGSGQIYDTLLIILLCMRPRII